MKSMVTSLAGSGYMNRAIEKQTASNFLRSRGGISQPESPRDVMVQPASRGVFVTWKLPQFHDNITGWRVYVNNESNLAAQIRDKGTRQLFVPTDSGATPPTVNIIVSSITTLGRESAKIQQQGSAIAETGAPTNPTAPPGYLDESSGGLNRSLIRFSGEKQYVRSS